MIQEQDDLEGNAFFDVTIDQIREALRIPEECSLIDVVWNPYKGMVTFQAQGPGLPPVEEDGTIRQLQPTINSIVTDSGRTYYWHWGDPVD